MESISLILLLDTSNCTRPATSSLPKWHGVSFHTQVIGFSKVMCWLGWSHYVIVLQMHINSLLFLSPKHPPFISISYISNLPKIQTSIKKNLALWCNVEHEDQWCSWCQAFEVYWYRFQIFHRSCQVSFLDTGLNGFGARGRAETMGTGAAAGAFGLISWLSPLKSLLMTICGCAFWFDLACW